MNTPSIPLYGGGSFDSPPTLLSPRRKEEFTLLPSVEGGPGCGLQHKPKPPPEGEGFVNLNLSKINYESLLFYECT